MPIGEVLKDDDSFSPEDAAALVRAFVACVTKLELTDRDDPATTTVAKVIFQLAKEGERDPEQLCARTIKLLSN
jgi:hypothetical protein